MKPKDLNNEHKEFLKSQGMDKHKYLFIRKTLDDFIFFEKSTKKVFEMRR